MRAALAAMVLAASLVSFAGTGNAATDPAEVWKPMYPFIGTWKGTRTEAGASMKVTRVYASAATNHHLEITESGGKSRAVIRGTVSLDAERQVLVLRQIAADGSATDAPLDPSSSPTQVVFASPGSEASRTRVTYERTGANVFVERIEHSSGGEAFAVVSETRFTRAD